MTAEDTKNNRRQRDLSQQVSFRPLYCVQVSHLRMGIVLIALIPVLDHELDHKLEIQPSLKSLFLMTA